MTCTSSLNDKEATDDKLPQMMVLFWNADFPHSFVLHFTARLLASTNTPKGPIKQVAPSDCAKF